MKLDLVQIVRATVVVSFAAWLATGCGNDDSHPPFISLSPPGTPPPIVQPPDAGDAAAGSGGVSGGGGAGGSPGAAGVDGGLAGFTGVGGFGANAGSPGSGGFAGAGFAGFGGFGGFFDAGSGVGGFR